MFITKVDRKTRTITVGEFPEKRKGSKPKGDWDPSRRRWQHQPRPMMGYPDPVPGRDARQVAEMAQKAREESFEKFLARMEKLDRKVGL